MVTVPTKAAFRKEYNCLALLKQATILYFLKHLSACPLKQTDQGRCYKLAEKKKIRRQKNRGSADKVKNKTLITQKKKSGISNRGIAELKGMYTIADELVLLVKNWRLKKV